MLFKHSLKRAWPHLASMLLVLALALAWFEGSADAAHAQAKAAPEDLLLGEWWTEGNEGRVRFTKDKDGLFRGTTTCCEHANDPKNPSRDIHNPNPKQRGRSTVGIIIIWKLKYEDGEYVDGYVYNPRDGKTYRIEAKVIDHQTVKIRGYMGISLLGQNQIWKRVQPSAPKASTTATR